MIPFQSGKLETFIPPSNSSPSQTPSSYQYSLTHRPLTFAYFTNQRKGASRITFSFISFPLYIQTFNSTLYIIYPKTENIHYIQQLNGYPCSFLPQNPNPFVNAFNAPGMRGIISANFCKIIAPPLQPFPGPKFPTHPSNPSNFRLLHSSSSKIPIS